MFHLSECSCFTSVHQHKCRCQHQKQDSPFHCTKGLAVHFIRHSYLPLSLPFSWNGMLVLHSSVCMPSYLKLDVRVWCAGYQLTCCIHRYLKSPMSHKAMETILHPVSSQAIIGEAHQRSEPAHCWTLLARWCASSTPTATVSCRIGFQCKYSHIPLSFRLLARFCCHCPATVARSQKGLALYTSEILLLVNINDIKYIQMIK